MIKEDRETGKREEEMRRVCLICLSLLFQVIEELSHWNLSIQPHMLEVQGRVLPQEVVIFRDNVRERGRERQRGRETERQQRGEITRESVRDRDRKRDSKIWQRIHRQNSLTQLLSSLFRFGIPSTPTRASGAV